MSAAITSLMMVFMDSPCSASADQMQQPIPVRGRQAHLWIVGPVNDEGPAFDVLAGEKSPVAAVLRVVPVVTHHEVLPRRNSHRAVAHTRIVANRERRRLVHEVGIWFVELHAVDVHLLLLQLER